jgi:hypothetical protein
MTRSLRQLFAIFVIAGLIWAPLTAPAAADAMRSASMAEMADDMPCCPPSSLPSDCQKCPLIGLCIAKTFQGMPSEAVIAHPTWSHSQKGSPSSDGARDGLGYLPLPRPPRSLGLPA